MKIKHLMATAFLGAHFALRLGKRALFMKSAGLNDFLEFYKEDRIASISPEEKRQFHDFAKCITCGLCDALCPAIAQWDQRKLLGPSALAHLARSIPDFAGHLSLDLQGCDSCRGCESICPEGVPIQDILRFLKTKSELYA